METRSTAKRCSELGSDDAEDEDEDEEEDEEDEDEAELLQSSRQQSSLIVSSRSRLRTIEVFC